ncbi:DUF3667 domain-containing protein [Pseudoduganella violaceinigra]|uniref:DUF3667 domain-containing protein n=1 Tax=Pseudoduganella violaceinigra TaxID=246602 RepID=UPI000405A124|nr:DUF3667 domain-containing protein [Pseudoduganella violaceinigra]
MGLEIEAAGDLVTATLVASEVEGEAGQSGAHADAGPCANCGTPVTANYCGNCGQKGHLHKSVLHLGEELLHGLLHFDTKGWRTLPLLVMRPGELTRRYIDGQRTRFVSPLALFLFMMFFMFFVFSLTVGTHSTSDAEDGKDSAVTFEQKINKKIAGQNALIAKAEKELKEVEAGSPKAEKAQRRLEKAQKELAGLNVALQAGKAALGDPAKVNEAKSKPEEEGKAASPDSSEKDTGKDDDIAAEVIRDVATGVANREDKAEGKRGLHSDLPWVDKAIKHAADNPELAKYKLVNAAYKYAFLLVPISLPFLWLMFFWRRGITMYDHAVFSLYSLCFMSLLLAVFTTLGHFGFGVAAGLLLVFAPPVHMYRQLRGAYALSNFGALWRTCFLLLMALIVLSIYALVVLTLSAA